MNCDSEERPIIESDILTIVDHPIISTDRPIESIGGPSRGTNLDESVPDNTEFKSIKRRWFVLFAMFTLGLSIGVTEMLAPILKVILDLLSLTDLRIYSWILSACSYLPLVTTLPTAWIIDKHGLKFGIYAGVVVTVLRNGFRALFFSPNLPLWSKLRYPYWILSTIFNQQITTLFFCLPLKVSETWFKEEERFTAWAIIIIGFEIGAAMSAYLIPLYITDRHTTYILAYSNVLIAIVLFVTVLICVRDSTPPTPPNDRIIKSTNSTVSYRNGLKIMLTNRDFMVHTLFLTSIDTIAIAISPILQDILESSQYDNKFCGKLLSIGAISGAVFLFVSSYSVLIVKTSAVGCKILACLFTLSFILYFQVIQLPNHHWLIISMSLLSSFISSTTRPCFQNISAHLCSGFVREATISGFAVTLVIFLNSICSLIVVYLRKSINNGQYTYKDSMMFLSVTSVVITFLYVLLFKGKQPENNSN